MIRLVILFFKSVGEIGLASCYSHLQHVLQKNMGDCSLFSQLAHEGFEGWPRSPRNPSIGSSDDDDFAVISGCRSSAIVTLLLSSPSRPPASSLRWLRETTVSSFSLLASDDEEEDGDDDDRLVWGNASMTANSSQTTSCTHLAAGTFAADRSVFSAVPHWPGQHQSIPCYGCSAARPCPSFSSIDRWWFRVPSTFVRWLDVGACSYLDHFLENMDEISDWIIYNVPCAWKSLKFQSNISRQECCTMKCTTPQGQLVDDNNNFASQCATTTSRYLHIISRNAGKFPSLCAALHTKTMSSSIVKKRKQEGSAVAQIPHYVICARWTFIDLFLFSSSVHVQSTHCAWMNGRRGETLYVEVRLCTKLFENFSLQRLCMKQR